MAQWTFSRQGGATLQLLGGTMRMERLEEGGLLATWTSAELRDVIVTTRMPHVPRFSFPTSLGEDLALDAGTLQVMLQAKWLGAVASWRNAPEIHAFERLLHGSEEVSGTASWIAVVGLRDHLRKVYPGYLERYAMEPHPPLYVADSDPL